MKTKLKIKNVIIMTMNEEVKAKRISIVLPNSKHISLEIIKPFDAKTLAAAFRNLALQIETY